MAEDTGQELQVPPEFSGLAQLSLYTTYGDPRRPGWEQIWITTWHPQIAHVWFPLGEIRIHRHFMILLEEAFRDLERKGLNREIHSAHHCYQQITLLNSPVLSVHSWGAAIDLNAAENPTGGPGAWSPEFIAMMTAHGICCGQNWTGNKEPMHFAMVDGQ